jgi:hypothetical protein
MKMKLNFTHAKLTHINTRIEKHGEEDKLACDLDVEFEMTAEEILPMLCAGDWTPWKSALWMDDAEKKVREPALKPLAFTNKFDEHTLRFSTNLDCKAKDLKDERGIIAKLHKFTITPQHGAVVLVECQVQLRPSATEFAQFGEGVVQKDICISVDPPKFPVGQKDMLEEKQQPAVH